MIALRDLLALLDKVPVWKSMKEIPDRVDKLEQRIADLESRLSRAPGEACPACGEYAMRLHTKGRVVGSFPMERRTDVWECGACGHKDEKQILITQQS